MKEDLLGSMKKGILAQRSRVKEALVGQLKMQVPKVGIPAWRQIQAKDNIHPTDLIGLIKEFGQDAVEKMFGDIEKLRADGRRTKNG
jgi:hypothetical protein